MIKKHKTTDGFDLDFTHKNIIIISFIMCMSIIHDYEWNNT